MIVLLHPNDTCHAAIMQPMTPITREHDALLYETVTTCFRIGGVAVNQAVRTIDYEVVALAGQADTGTRSR